jgi:hypothetical protein
VAATGAWVTNAFLSPNHAIFSLLFYIPSQFVDHRRPKQAVVHDVVMIARARQSPAARYSASSILQFDA